MERREFIKAVVKIYDSKSGLFDCSKLLVVTDIHVEEQPNCFSMVEVQVDEQIVVGSGFSKVCYPDKWNIAKGARVARNRALVNLAEKLYRTPMRPSTAMAIIYGN